MAKVALTSQLANKAIGSAFCKGNARSIDLQQHQSQHQCPKGMPITINICWIMSDNPQIFKIVLSKAFDLKCTIPEITNVGEPLLIYQSC